MNKQSFFEFYYQGTYFSLHLYRAFSQTYLNNTRQQKESLFKLDEGALRGYDIEIEAPSGFTQGIPDINEVSDLRIKFIKYNVNPFFIEIPEMDQLVESSVVIFELMDALGQKIDLNITKRAEKIGMF